MSKFLIRILVSVVTVAMIAPLLSSSFGVYILGSDTSDTYILFGLLFGVGNTLVSPFMPWVSRWHSKKPSFRIIDTILIIFNIVVNGLLMLFVYSAFWRIQSNVISPHWIIIGTQSYEISEQCIISSITGVIIGSVNMILNLALVEVEGLVNRNSKRDEPVTKDKRTDEEIWQDIHRQDARRQKVLEDAAREEWEKEQNRQG
jgi:hypothetical protein